MRPGSTMLGELVRRCDVAVIDLDQCIYPRFTEARLGAGILGRGLAGKLGLRKGEEEREISVRLGALLAGAAYLSFHRAGRLLGRRPRNEELLRAFGRVFSGFPVALLQEEARALPGKGPDTWKEALARLSRLMPLYLCTFSVEPIARAYGEVTVSGRPIFSGWRGTSFLIREGRVAGVEFQPGDLGPESKRRRLDALLRKGGFCRPLIIGHGRDEALMAKRARELGGGSLALRRWGSETEAFDLVLGRGAWRRLAAALPASV